MEYKLLGYAAAGIIALYFALRIAGHIAFSKLVGAEMEHILDSEEHKVKGRFQ